MKLIIAGFGKVAESFDYTRLSGIYNEIFGTIRSVDRQSLLLSMGVVPVILNLDSPEIPEKMDTTDSHVLYFVPPPGGGFKDTRVLTFCSILEKTGIPSKIVYISTTAVYAEEPAGVWIDEERTADPQTSRGKRRLDAENRFLDFCSIHNSKAVILRVSGIYGPGRLPVIQLVSGQPLLFEKEAKPSNRIHIDDLLEVCLKSLGKGEHGDIFNVSDGHPSTLTEYFIKAASILGLDEPEQVTYQEAIKVMPPLMLSYFSEGNLISNKKLIEKLGVKLKYETLDDGLPSCRTEISDQLKEKILNHYNL